MEHRTIKSFNAKKITNLYNRLPHVNNQAPLDCICYRCHYVNSSNYKFCSNCGYPLKENGTHILYQLRTKQRRELLKKSEHAIQSARIAFYILSTFFLAGMAFLFGSLDNRYVLAFAFVTLSALFFLLARWSIINPFTAIITGFIIVITFSTISIFGEFIIVFTTVQGVYSIVVSMTLIYFLLKGVQGAYKADLIKEEMEFN